MTHARRSRRDASGRYRSLGRRLLLGTLEGTTQTVLARDLSRFCSRPVSQATVSRLVTGKLHPDSYELRAALWRRCGIPLEAWDQSDAVNVRDAGRVA